MSISTQANNYKGQSIIFVLSEGNPGAMRVLMESFSIGEKIDPHNAFGAFGFMHNLQAVGISGHLIWCLYKDVCGENLSEAIAMVRAVQLGIISRDELLRRITDQDSRGLGPIFQKVQDKLPDFKFDIEP